MTRIEEVKEFVKLAVAVSPVEPVPTGRHTRRLTVAVVCALIVSIGVSFELGFHSQLPLWGMLVVAPIWLLATMMSRLTQDGELYFDHSAVVMVVAACWYGPWVGALATIVVDLIGQWPQYRVKGNKWQSSFGTSCKAITAVACGVTFALAVDAGAMVGIALALAYVVAMVVNCFTNVLFFRCAGIDDGHYVNDFIREESVVLAFNWGIMLAVLLAAPVSPFAFLAFLTPVLVGKLSEFHEVRLRQAVTELNVDVLTGVHNRRFFYAKLQELVATSDDTQEVFCLLMCDIDNFKILNDTHGHLEGDNALAATARALADAMPANAFVCRYGGEEFGVLVPGRSIAETAAAADLARIAVRHTLMPWGTSISMGVAAYEGAQMGDDRASMLIDIADKALYRSKANGKDQVMIGTAALLAGGDSATENDGVAA